MHHNWQVQHLSAEFLNKHSAAFWKSIEQHHWQVRAQQFSDGSMLLWYSDAALDSWIRMVWSDFSC